MSVRDILKFSYRCLSRESPGTSCFRHYLDNISDALLPSNLVCVTDNSLLGTVYPFEALRHLTKDTKLHIAFCFHIKLTLETEFHLLLYCFLVYSNGVPQSPTCSLTRYSEVKMPETYDGRYRSLPGSASIFPIGDPRHFSDHTVKLKCCTFWVN